ncbi:hypothetical protein [Thermophilibacter provencensis]|uniref:Uncharacterized protein n=1 Tax=Thermophilibacter provencensis TaxID=1852386 RepID=A0ABT7V1B4_9ACTN|nr:hypothetical protein [Thermophilibacter provencensis]MDM8270404.1 hypothetical protein [Thermophilibacter provencensis]
MFFSKGRIVVGTLIIVRVNETKASSSLLGKRFDALGREMRAGGSFRPCRNLFNWENVNPRAAVKEEGAPLLSPDIKSLPHNRPKHHGGGCSDDAQGLQNAKLLIWGKNRARRTQASAFSMSAQALC